MWKNCVKSLQIQTSGFENAALVSTSHTITLNKLYFFPETLKSIWIFERSEVLSQVRTKRLPVVQLIQGVFLQKLPAGLSKESSLVTERGCVWTVNKVDRLCVMSDEKGMGANLCHGMGH